MLSPEQAEQLAVQRKAVRRAKAQGRRWFLRSLVMLAIAWWAFWRGGSLNLALGIAMTALAVLSISLGRSLRHQAREIERKLDVLAGSGTPSGEVPVA